MAKRKSAKTSPSGEAGEPDTLHPRLTEALFGHEEAEALFLSAFTAGALHHAWLITGERGTGKATFAYRAARFLLSQGQRAPAPAPSSLAVPPGHPIARQIAAGAHPSLFVLEAEAGANGSIGVDSVRKLRSFLSLTSPGGWRAVIVDSANELTIASANALLKAVEEPPPRTAFFLVSHGASRVMPTIRSRCVKLGLSPLHEPDFHKAVAAACSRGDLAEPGDAEMAKLFALSAGSPGRAIELIAGGVLSLAGKVERIMEGLPRLGQTLVQELVQAASGARNAETFAQVCDLIEERVAERAKKEAIEQPELASAASWAALWQALRERRLELETLNLDKGAFLVSIFSDMERISRKQ